MKPKRKADDKRQLALPIRIPPNPPRRLSPYALQLHEKFYNKPHTLIQPPSQPFSSDAQKFHEKYSALKATPLSERSPNYFPWPNTIKARRLAPLGWPETDLLHQLGYVIENNESHRRFTLKTLFEQERIPPIVSGVLVEVAKWGGACSAKRLKQIAAAIANSCFWERQRTSVEAHREIDDFCPLGKKKAPIKTHHTGEHYASYGYEADLAWLKKEYYDGKFDK